MPAFKRRITHASGVRTLASLGKLELADALALRARSTVLAEANNLPQQERSYTLHHYFGGWRPATSYTTKVALRTREANNRSDAAPHRADAARM